MNQQQIDEAKIDLIVAQYGYPTDPKIMRMLLLIAFNKGFQEGLDQAQDVVRRAGNGRGDA